MAVNLSPCFQAFIAALTTVARAQLRQLLLALKQMIEVKITTTKALVNRHDVTAQVYKNSLDQLNNFLAPIESAMSILPLDTLSGCSEGSTLFSNLQNRYYDYKSTAEDLSYKYAQFGFASTYTSKLQEEMQNELSKIEDVISYIDNLALGGIGIGSRVIVYQAGATWVANSKGTITNLSATQVTVTLDPFYGGISIVTFAGNVGVINS